MEPRKLTMLQAEKIRELYQQGATQNQLAKWYSVCKETIKNIVQKKSYTYDKEYGKTLF